jgi:hypothetical protein
MIRFPGHGNRAELVEFLRVVKLQDAPANPPGSWYFKGILLRE